MSTFTVADRDGTIEVGPVQAVVLVTAFAAEVAAWVAAAQWAWWIASPTSRLVLVPAALLAVYLPWARWLAPRAPHLLPGPWSRVGKSLVFAVSALAAVPVWGSGPAIALALIGIGTAAFARHPVTRSGR